MNSGNLQQQDLDAALARAESVFGQGQFEQSATLYMQVLGLLEHIHGPMSPELAYTLQRLGDSFHALNRFRDSLPIYQRLLSIGHQILGSSHPDMLNLMVKIARTQESIGSYQESRRTYDSAISAMEAALGPNHEMVQRTRESYEGLLARIEENKRAAQAWRESTPSPQGLPPDSNYVPVPGQALGQMPGQVPAQPTQIPAPIEPQVSVSFGTVAPANNSGQPWAPPVSTGAPTNPLPVASSSPLPSFPPRPDEPQPWGPPGQQAGSVPDNFVPGMPAPVQQVPGSAQSPNLLLNPPGNPAQMPNAAGIIPNSQSGITSGNP
ncbi:MAG: tetratricopeptide repeat protein, partial [Candidatus Obscuribacterales bacterium]|nr:tetratricopeptide repeat protein [Candidatus Obscuribacterales bacterium]